MEPLRASDLVRTFLENRDGLFGYLLALTHDRESAEEVFQEVGLVIVEEGRRQTVVANFLPWAHEIARRRVAEHFRKNSRRKGMERLDSLDEIVGRAFEENATDREAVARREEYLEECLEELPPTQREMIERRYRHQESLRDIARKLEWTDGAVKVALWKVRRRLAECVDGKMETGE